MKGMAILLLALFGSLGLPLSGFAGDADIGRLFHTPKERRAMDAQRYGAFSERDRLSLDGMVKGSDGRVVRWVNGEPQVVNRRNGSQGGKVLVEVRPGERVWMKPGQFFETDTGKVREHYEQPSGTQ